MTQDHDGISGSDNVRPLFDHSPSAAGLPPQQDVIDTLCELLIDAQKGKVAGLAFIAFDAQGNTYVGTRGKAVFSALVTELETMKIKAILAQEQHYHTCGQ